MLACSRQTPTGGRQEEPIEWPEARSPCTPPEYRKLVAQHQDLQLLEIVRSYAQGQQLQNLPKREIADRVKHTASDSPAHSTCVPAVDHRRPIALNSGDRLFEPFTIVKRRHCRRARLRPWTVAFPLNRDDQYRIYEDACHE